MYGSDGLQQPVATQTGGAGKKKVTRKALRELVELQGFQCALTGIDLTPETAALDHIIPISKGGPHCMDNVQVLDARVNAAKGTLTNEEFVELCELVIRHAGKNG